MRREGTAWLLAASGYRIESKSGTMKKIYVLVLIILPITLLAQQDSTSKVVFQDVIVNAVKATDKDPHTQTSLTKTQLNERNTGRDLPYLLDQQPNVIVTSDAGAGTGYTGMRIRGSDLSRINVTINGIPMNDAESQQVYFVDMPDLASSTNAIQIQRGVGASTNGGGAFGASVNMQTNGFSPHAYGRFATNYGSFNTWKHTLEGGSGLIKNKFFIEGRLSKISSDGYIDRAKSDLWSYYIHTGLLLNKTKIQLIHFSGFEKTYQAWNGVPEDSLNTNPRFNSAGTDYGANPVPWSNQIDNYRQHYMQLFLTQTISRHWSLNVAGFTTIGKGYYEEYKVDQKLTKYQLSSTAASRSDVIRRRWLDNVYYGGLLGIGYEKKKVDVKFGGMFSQYQGKHYGTVVWCRECETVNSANHYYYSTGLKRDINFFAKVNYSPVPKLMLYADVQYRFVQHAIQGNNNDLVDFDIKNTWHFFNPKAGLKVLINPKNQLYVSFAMANKEPSRDEQINNQNSPLQPETLYDAELGYQYKQKRFSLQLNGYFMYYKNQLLLSGKLNDVGNPIKINTPKSYRAGVELAADGVLWLSKKDQRALLSAGLNLSYSVNRIINFQEKVPTYDADYNLIDTAYMVNNYATTTIAFSPSIVGGFTLASEPVKNFQIKLLLKYISRQYLDNTQAPERSIKPYAYGDITLSYLYPIKDQKSVRFNFSVYNFWNQKYVSNGYTYRERYVATDGVVSDPSHYNFYYPQAGIHCTGGIDVNF